MRAGQVPQYTDRIWVCPSHVASTATEEFQDRGARFETDPSDFSSSESVPVERSEMTSPDHEQQTVFVKPYKGGNETLWRLHRLDATDDIPF
jgi:hypothetical protein